MKNQYTGELSKKGGGWTVCRFKEGLGEKEEVVFLRRVDTPMHTMSLSWALKKCWQFPSAHEGDKAYITALLFIRNQ